MKKYGFIIGLILAFAMVQSVGAQQKRVLESMVITTPGTGYKLYDEFYPLSDSAACHNLFEPIVQIEGVDQNGGIQKVYIYKGGSYYTDCANVIPGITLFNTKGMGTGAVATIHITQLAPKAPKVTITHSTTIVTE